MKLSSVSFCTQFCPSESMKTVFRAVSNAIPKFAAKSAEGGQIVRMVSPELAKVIGTDTSTFRNALSQVWTYIVDKNLQDTQNRLLVNPDPALRAAFPKVNDSDKLSAANIMKGINANLSEMVAKEEFKPYQTAKMKQQLRVGPGPPKLRKDGKLDKRFKANRLKAPRVVPVFFTSAAFQDFLLNSGLSFTSREPVSAMTAGKAIKYIWAYAKQQDLQISNPGTHFKLDAKLKKLFNITEEPGVEVVAGVGIEIKTDSMLYLELTSHVFKHMVAVVPRAKQSTERSSVRRARVLPVAPAFQPILGGHTELDRYQAMKLFFRYLYDNNCQDPKDKKYFYPTEELRKAINNPLYDERVVTADIMKIIHSGTVLLKNDADKF